MTEHHRPGSNLKIDGDHRRANRRRADLQRPRHVLALPIAHGGHGRPGQALAMTLAGSVGLVVPRGTWPRPALVLGAVASLWLFGQLVAWLHIIGQHWSRRVGILFGMGASERYGSRWDPTVQRRRGQDGRFRPS